MRPAVLADLVGRGRVETLAGAQLLHELTAKLELASLLVALGLQLAQPLTGTDDHNTRCHVRLTSAGNRRCKGS